jgi:hypothetical protein
VGPDESGTASNQIRHFISLTKLEISRFYKNAWRSNVVGFAVKVIVQIPPRNHQGLVLGIIDGAT